MSFFNALQAATAADREYLFAAPIIADSIAGRTDLPTYVAYLCQAYHHVKHTTPLLMAAGSRFTEQQEWLRNAMAEYIEEECGHQEWILNDIEACGYDRGGARASLPTVATEVMVAYAYHTIDRVSPVGFFGMVHVLEGTSIALADRAADALQAKLGLPDGAFTYLRSHGSLDQEHVKFFSGLMDRIDNAADQKQIVHCAQVFYRLFGDVLRSVAAEQVAELPRRIQRGDEHAA